MVIATVLIPILIIYFYRLTTKEKRTYYQKWQKINNVSRNATIKGKVIRVASRREKFYQNLYIYVTELWIETTNNQKVTAIKKEQVIEERLPDQFNKGDYVSLEGQWDDKTFLF